ncbi:hypothetical protein GCM10022255_102380 [Dactylosporangium darangshiense]|uniref:Lipoprotein n=2 Tax=Dactylosporangium darangshiense TaxID=579108 RepID=A0ABP8DSF3_9ACTN
MLALAVVVLAGCARTGDGAVEHPAGVDEAEVYAAVLRRYLGTPSENSFPDRAFPAVYVLDQAHADAADPAGPSPSVTPITADTQRAVVAALDGTAKVVFVATREAVVETRDGCAQVMDGGILVTLGPPRGDEDRVTVAVNGFVACLGATWLTYVVRHDPGTGWRVTGTTGTMAVA